MSLRRGTGSAGAGAAVPIGAAGGDLEGSYPNPTVKQINTSDGACEILVPLKLNAAAGTFPTIGLVRFKDAETALLTCITGGTDKTLISANGNNVSLGADINNANAYSTVSINPSASGNVYLVYGSTTCWQFTDTGGSPAFGMVAYVTTADPQITQRQQTGDVATRKISLIGQQASTSATGANEDGGNVEIGGGVPDGAGVYGLVKTITELDHGYFRYSWPSDANQTLSVSDSRNNMLRLFAGTITAARDLTISRRAAAPGQVWVRNVTGFTINVGWLTGTKVAVANNTSALIGTTGTNAELIMAGS